jgi:hypothetical protein
MDNTKRPISKVSSRWARGLERRKELRDMKQLEANAIQEAIEQAMIDSGASRTFVKSADGMELRGTSDKQLMAANGGSLSATHTALLPTRALFKGARESYVVPGVQESLVSVPDCQAMDTQQYSYLVLEESKFMRRTASAL